MFGCTLPDAFDYSWASDQCAPRVSTPLILVSIALRNATPLTVPEENEMSFTYWFGRLLRLDELNGYQCDCDRRHMIG